MTAGGLKVLHVSDSLAIGGAERLLARLATAPERDFEMAIAVLRASVDPELGRAVADAGVPVDVFPMAGDRLELHPATLWRFVRHLRTGGFDVVHTHLNSSHVVGVLGARLAGLPSVSSIHGVRGASRSLRERARMAVLRRVATELVAVGRTVAEDHAGDLRGRTLHVVPNPAPPAAEDPRPRREVRAELGVAEEAPLLVAVGRLVELKNHRLLVASMRRIRATHPRVRAVVAGPGELQASLEREAADLEGAVRFLGARTDVPDLLHAADLFVSTSSREGMPLAILEAMAQGVPVVATDVGDCAEVVEDAGVLVPSGDAAALAAAVVALVDDPDRRRSLGQAAARKAADDYGLGRWIDRLGACYQAAAGTTVTS